MTRILSLAAAFVASAAALTAAAGPARAAAPAGAYYVATPEAPAARPRLMTRATVWQLSGDRYVAARAPERADVLCELVARDVGRLSAFSAGGAALDADALAKCNRRAKGGAAPAMASK